MGVEQASLTQMNAGTLFWFTLPLTFTLGIWLPGYIYVWAGFCFWAGFAWTAVHRNIHDEQGYWYAWILCPWLLIVKWNHLKHHENPRIRYGGMFWFLVDPLFGTCGMIGIPKGFLRLIRGFSLVRRFQRMIHLGENVPNSHFPRHQAIDYPKWDGGVIIACSCGRIFGPDQCE